ncbi:MAG: tRNA dihydrouridine synthase [Phycisphaerales bacterium]
MLAQPLQIGPVRIATNLLLAPVAGYCDLAFRTVCREWGGVGLACTDLLSPQGLLRGTATSLDLARTNDFDKPVGMQLYGSDPAIMGEGARWAVEHGATVVDINMGCPVDKVTKKEGGSKLLTDLTRALAIVRACVKALEGASGGRVPLTCKIRLCWADADYTAGNACSPELARTLADEGVAAVTVHGRTTEQKFSGAVRLEGIARVVDAVAGRIPVIGNGDVRTPRDAESMIRTTGCAGVMIGRGAFSRPWLFRDCWTFLSTGRAAPAPTEREKIATVRRYFDLLREHRGDRDAMDLVRKRISWFAKGLGVWRNGADTESVSLKPFKESVRLAADPAAVYAALAAYLEGDERRAPGEEHLVGAGEG